MLEWNKGTGGTETQTFAILDCCDCPRHLPREKVYVQKVFGSHSLLLPAGQSTACKQCALTA